MLIGRWKPRQIRIWSLAYLRFWIVKTLIRPNPLVLFVGSPLYVLYLRALGAKIGRGVVIFSAHVPVCTDLLTIGDGTVIRKDSFINGYRAHAGLIQTGSVTLGQNVFVGESTVIDIETSMGDGAQLGHASSLHSRAGGAGRRALARFARPQRTEVDYRTVATAANCGALRRVGYTVRAAAERAGGVPAVGDRGLERASTVEFPQLRASCWTPGPAALTTCGVLPRRTRRFLGAVLRRPSCRRSLFVITVPRLLNLAITPDRVYRCTASTTLVHRTIAAHDQSEVLHRPLR